MIDVARALPGLDSLRRRNLETDIVTLLAQRFGLNAAAALDVYYRSRLSRQIAENAYGIQALDAAYLVEDLIENEPELFADITRLARR